MKNSLIYKLYKRVNAKCKEKTGSTLLMVVMTMSVLIIIGSSFMVLSQNSALDGIFASSQVKAEQTALSVANVIKQNMGDIIEERLFDIQNNGTNSTTFSVDTPNLFGSCKVTLSGDSYSANGNVPNTVTIKIEATVGRSTETLVFTAQLTTNDTYNMINAVTNSAVANGGSVNYSFPSGGIDGDVSLSGDYLLALYRGNEDRGEVSVTGNVYCNGSLVLGARVYRGSGDKNDPNSYNSLSTEITKNVYVNGDLIINSCDILGDVYVSGNILFNGLNNYNAYIGGNIYCGGNMYVTGTPFERYATTDNKVGDNDTGFKLVYSENNDGAFPAFPTADEIKLNSLLYASYASHILTATKESKESNIVYTGLNGDPFDFASNPVFYVDNNNRTYLELGNDNYISAQSVNGVPVLHVDAKHAGLYFQESAFHWGTVHYDYYTTSSVKAVYKLWERLIEVSNGRNARFQDYLAAYKTNIANYINKPADYYYRCIANSYFGNGTYKTLEVKGNIIVQNDSYIEANNTLAADNTDIFYTGGTLEFASAKAATALYGISAPVSFKSTNVFSGNGKINVFGEGQAKDAFSTLQGNVLYGYVMGWASDNSWNYHTKQCNAEWTPDYRSGYYVINSANKTNGWWTRTIGFNDSNYFNLYSYKSSVTLNDYAKVQFTNPSNSANVFFADRTGDKKYYEEICNAASGYDLSTASVTNTVQGMYSSYLLNQNQSNNAWERKGIVSGTANVNPTTVKQIFQEMGVYGYNAEEVYNRDYMNRSDPEADYELTGNKANDLHGVNFTGIAINQIKFASTLEQALNCDVIVHNKYELYDRLICLEYLAHLSGGTVAGNTWNDANMYKATEWLRAQWAAGNYTQFIGIKYNFESDHWRYLIMKDVYFDETPANITYGFNDNDRYERYECHCGCHVLNDNEYRYWSTLTKGLVFGNNSLGSRRYEHMQIDTTYGDVRIYIRPTNTIKYNQNSYTAQNAMAIQYSVFETKDYKVKNGMANADTGVAYMIFIPTFYKWTGAQWQELDSPELLASHVDDMVSAKLTSEEISGKEVFSSNSGTKYAYASTEAERLKLYLTNYTAAIQDQEHAGFFCQDNSVMFIMCEGPMQIWCGLATNLQGVVYTPHKDSVVYLGNSLAEMTGGTSNDSMSGGSIVTGNIVMDYSVNEGPWANNTMYRPLHPDDMTADEYKNYLADKLLQGLGQIQTEADSSSSTTREWHFSAFK